MFVRSQWIIKQGEGNKRETSLIIAVEARAIYKTDTWMHSIQGDNKPAWIRQWQTVQWGQRIIRITWEYKVRDITNLATVAITPGLEEQGG